MKLLHLSKSPMPTRRGAVLAGALLLCRAVQGAQPAPAPSPPEAQQPASRAMNGYQGIWFTLGQVSEFGDKYSGGLGTYTAKHVPLAVYSPRADKTFFVYGGTIPGERHLLIMAAYYDHATGTVPRPVVVHDKQGISDPHDNASLALDDAGYLWVFVSGRGRARPGFKYRSRAPLSIDGFDRVREEEMTYPQPWWISGRGFLHLFTKYTAGRELYWETSADGATWSDDSKLAGMGGHYQVSAQRDGRVITAFNMHPGGNVDRRTNLYFLQTSDLGETWQTAGGIPVATPVTDPRTPALVRDFQAEDRLVYLKDITFDRAGNPAILVLTSAHHAPGPRGDPRVWTVAHWTGSQWRFAAVTRSTHNYDMGSLYIEPEGLWRILAPTEPGPQPLGTGGEVALWESRDEGRTWTKARDVTRQSEFNHAYVRRPVNAHPDFYAFWADGNPDAFSESRLYFTNRAADTVWLLPPVMEGAIARPQACR